MGEHITLNPEMLVVDARAKGNNGQWKFSRKTMGDRAVAFAKNWALNVLCDISHDEAKELWEFALDAAQDVPGEGADEEAILTIQFRLKEIIKRRMA